MYAEIKKKITIEELREILTLMEHQETTEKYTATTLHINGNNAEINAEIDTDGNIIIE